MKKIFSWLLPLIFCAAFIYGRTVYYGQMDDSVAVQDTGSYFETAEKASLKLTFFEQPRSITFPLLIRFSNPSGEYELTQMAEPYFETEPRLAVQPGTEAIVRNQTIISIFCWIGCTLLIVSSLDGWFPKALAAFLILSFGFVPQIADWDSILSSESLNFSLFALLVGLLIKVLPNGKADNFGAWAAGIGLVIVNFLWIFTRDTNAYFVLAEAVLLIIAAIIYWTRRSGQRISALLCGFMLAGIFIFHQGTFRESERWLVPLFNNLVVNIFPYEERVEFFEENNMPVDEKTLSLTGSAEYNEITENEKLLHWARRFGMQTYQRWLLSMPLWCVQQVYENLDSFFEENRQPFFYGSKEQRPHWAEKPGNLLHPLSAAVIVIDFLLIIFMGTKMVRSGSSADIRFFWLLLIMFLGGGLLMSLAYLGEVRSVWRHVLGGVMALRLTLWLGLCALFSKPSA
ncbi:MAG: hypothetical protein IJI07_09525 [Flexilinea sp.]|nr:hypothetical protein [Flexilinea sp.]